MGNKKDSFVPNGTKQLQAGTMSICLGILKFHPVRIIE